MKNSFIRKYLLHLTGPKTADDVVFGQNSSLERTWRARCTLELLHRANLLPQHRSWQSIEPKPYV